MKPIIHEILRKSFRDAKENYHGCSFDHPSQKQHMNIGCLSPWSELRDVYIEKCFEEISVEDVLRRGGHPPLLGSGRADGGDGHSKRSGLKKIWGWADKNFVRVSGGSSPRPGVHPAKQ
uniref:Uncharacterized protein n=1 Tax=Magallana gigas TaxID=29159 RepID=A0A8W8MT42_MAGGI